MQMPDTGHLPIIILSVVIVIEVLISAFHNSGIYDTKDTRCNLILGVVLVFAGLFFKMVALMFFQWVNSYKFFDFGFGWMVWIAAILSCDLVYYLFHWLGHISHIFWANHSVHHSSGYYNYSVAVRNHFLHMTFRFLFWSPLCLIGFNPFMILFIDNCTNIYQFMMHTQFVRNLGPLEYVFNTPSHHRVHHASNKKYLDKNFGGIFIIYDKLFGTFCKEEEKPVFGITHNMPGTDFKSILFTEYAEIIKNVQGSHSFSGKLKAVFGRPGGRG